MSSSGINTPAGARELLSPQFMHALDRIDVLSRKVLAGKMQGERRSKRRGRSVEFADYRPYVMGDDLRFIDWNLYARLDRLFLRLFMEEEDLSVSVAVDASGSMDWGDPAKLAFARRLAAALAYVGLVNLNRVHLYQFAGPSLTALPALRGRQPIPRMLKFLSETPARLPGRATDLASFCRWFALTQRQKGLVVLISDFLDKGDLDDALRYLTPDRYDTYALQVLAPQEMDPGKAGLAGDLSLRDVEDGQTTEVSVTPALLARYRTTLAAFRDGLRQTCLRRDIAYMFSDTTAPVEMLVLRYFRERGLLR